MLSVTPNWGFPEELLEWSFVRGSGPGGQNVNKVATTAEVRLDMKRCPPVPGWMKQRLILLAGSRLTADGILCIESSRHRTQGMNRDDALAKLLELLREAAVPPKRRIKTKATAGSRRRNAETKQAHSQVKRLRQGRHATDGD